MAADDRPSTSGPTNAVGGPRSVAPTKPGSAEAAPLDLSRLTDQVVQAIDRRIIAQRERMGRI